MLPIPIMLYFLHYTDTVTLVYNHFPTYLMSAWNIFPYMVIRRWGLEAESMLGLNCAKLLELNPLLKIRS